ncbi:hypothetical protein [Phenylobacterium sp.]|uniref:hypothetical protein n=1 Tax=Phenylobacterium sp. TaxID=1871053 RepID=UPI00394CA99D
MPNLPTILTDKELAATLPNLFSVSMLKKARMPGSTVQGPPWLKFNGCVRYDLDAVLAWIKTLEQAANSAGTTAKGRSIADEISRRGRVR